MNQTETAQAASPATAPMPRSRPRAAPRGRSRRVRTLATCARIPLTSDVVTSMSTAAASVRVIPVAMPNWSRSARNAGVIHSASRTPSTMPASPATVTMAPRRQPARAASTATTRITMSTAGLTCTVCPASPAQS